MTISKDVVNLLLACGKKAEKNKYEYVTPEGLLLEMTFNDTFCNAFESCGGFQYRP